VRRVVARALVGALLGSLLLTAPAGATCTPRLLVLSAFPGEIGPLLSDATASLAPVDIGEHRYYTGLLRGKNVVLALTGIGTVNADEATSAALDAFGCSSGSGISGIVFSGVAGGKTNIGDVAVPATWTDAAGQVSTDATMLAVAKASGPWNLARDVPAGDVACAGADPDAVRPIPLEHQPVVLFDGTGKTADPFGGRALPCFPGGGDVFGCRPCHDPGASPADIENVTGIAPFLDPGFFFGYFGSPPPSETDFDAEDMETMAVARAAHQHSVPFIAFRGVSDGHGDPLKLPGFPFQFFVYRQLAADNAAAVTLAFLQDWAAG
jgi:nucleoside phosphorylase